MDLMATLGLQAGCPGQEPSLSSKRNECEKYRVPRFGHALFLISELKLVREQPTISVWSPGSNDPSLWLQVGGERHGGAGAA